MKIICSHVALQLSTVFLLCPSQHSCRYPEEDMSLCRCPRSVCRWSNDGTMVRITQVLHQMHQRWSSPFWDHASDLVHPCEAICKLNSQGWACWGCGPGRFRGYGTGCTVAAGPVQSSLFCISCLSLREFSRMLLVATLGSSEPWLALRHLVDSTECCKRDLYQGIFFLCFNFSQYLGPWWAVSTLTSWSTNRVSTTKGSGL